MFATITTIALLLTVFLRSVAGASYSTELGAGSIFSDVMLVKISYYRALAKANPVQWDNALQSKALQQAVNCGLEYDYFAPEGQIIFNIGRQDNKAVDIVNSTYFAVDHWWDQRHNYTVKSDQYDELSPFWPSWEFTEMVWAANTKLGCAWSPVECPLGQIGPDNPTGMVDSSQLVCLFTPGGNKWEQWGANVHCPDCAAQPQTETINPATIDFTSLTKRAEPTERALYVPGDADLERIEAFRTLPLEEFYPEYTRSPKASIQAPNIAAPTPAPAHTEVPARRANKRAEPPKGDDPNWQNMYIEKINAFRERHDVMDKVAFSTEALGHADRAAIWNAATGCSWPLPQDATLDKFNWAFWVTDDNTSDFAKEFDISLHMWEVWGNSSFVGSRWTTWFDQLLSPTTKNIGCSWVYGCNRELSKTSSLMYCAGDPAVPIRGAPPTAAGDTASY